MYPTGTGYIPSPVFGCTLPLKYSIVSGVYSRNALNSEVICSKDELTLFGGVADPA